MAFPFTYNRFLPVWLKNSNNVPSTSNGSVSLLNDGKTELREDTVILGNTGLKKSPDATYTLDASGSVRANKVLIIDTPVNSTEAIPLSFADGRYGRLAVANTFTELNTFRKGVLPCRGTGANPESDIQLGKNQLQYRQATSQYNISIGDLALVGSTGAAFQQYNTGKRNIALGHEALNRLDLGNDNIFIGYQAGKDCGSAQSHGVGISPSRCIAIGTFSQLKNLYATDSISIGYNSLINASGPAVGNICIGSNVGNGLTFQNNNVLIGNSCAPSVNDNAVTAIGNLALGAATGSFNSGTAVGWQAGYNNASGQGGTFVGAEAGFSNTSGTYNTCIGLKAGRPSAGTLNVTICIGFNSKAVSNNECVFGGEALTEQAQLTLPNKHRIAMNQSPTGATITLTFRSNENVIIGDASSVIINLPTPAGAQNIGAKFHLIRANATSNNITINAPASQTIGFFNSSNVYTTASSYTFLSSIQTLSLLCINNTGTSWVVLSNPPTSTAGFVDTTTNQTIGGVKTFSSPPVMSGASISAATIPVASIVDGSNLLNRTVNATITGAYTFSTVPIFSTGSLNPNYLTYFLSEPANQQYSIGQDNLYAKTVTALQNTAIGHSVMSSNGSLSGVFSGSGNCGYGAYCMYGSESATDNACYGNNSGYALLSGSSNSSFGNSNMYNTNGNENSHFGYNGGRDVFSATTISLQSCSSLGANTQFYDAQDHITLIGADTECDSPGAIHPSTNAIILGRYATDSTYVGQDLFVHNNATISNTLTVATISNSSAINTNTINAYSGVSTSVTSRLIANDFETTTINGSTANTCTIGTSSNSTKLNGSVFVSNDTQKINGFSSLSGTTNLSTPLSETYLLTTTSNGVVNLPIITSNMQGLIVNFVKTSAINTYTINCGAGDTIRLLQSDSTSAATSITMVEAETYLRLVATSGNSWSVLAKSPIYIKDKQNPTIVTSTGTTTTNVTMSPPYYEYNAFINLSTTKSIAYTLPTITENMVGMALQFRRLGGNMLGISFTPSSGQAVFATGTSLGQAGTTTIISTTQSSVTLVAMQVATAGEGTFTNTANSANVTINTVTSGFLAAGQSIVLNGNARTIVTCGTGRGLTGTYTVNAAIVAANTGQAYTSSVSYGWTIFARA